MRSELRVDRRPHATACFVVAIVAIVVVVLSWLAFKDRMRRDRADALEEARKQLGDAIVSTGTRFDRSQWLKERASGALSRARRELSGESLSCRVAIDLGSMFRRIFPTATIYAFDDDGKLAFQTGSEARRGREILWDGVVAFARDVDRDPASPRFVTGDHFCEGMYGSLTTLSDLVSDDASPKLFVDKGHMRLSWALLRESFIANKDPHPSSTEATKRGGIWIIQDPKALPTKAIGQRTVSSLPRYVDGALILRKIRQRVGFEVARGRFSLPRSVSEKIFAGEQSAVDRNGNLWAARYIPNENGRYLVAMVQASRFAGGIERHETVVTLFLLGLLGVALLFSIRYLLLGFPMDIGLRWQVAALFAVTSVIPFFAVVIEGLSLTAEHARRSELAMNHRINARLSTIDLAYVDFKDAEWKRLGQLEIEIAKRLPLPHNASSTLAGLVADLHNYGVILLDEHGTKTCWSRDFTDFLRQSGYPAMMGQQLARLVESEGRVPAKALTESSFTLEAGDHDRMLDTFFRLKPKFGRMHTQGRDVLQRVSMLRDPDHPLERTIGLINWLFDETEFAREFVTSTVIGQASSSIDGIQVGAIAPDGTTIPREWAASKQLLRMADRVSQFRSGESGIIMMPDGRSFFAVVSSPTNLGGYVTFGLVEALPRSQSRFTNDIAMAVGMRRTLPLDVERIATIRILMLSLILSLTLMVPMAGILSRWIVGRIGLLRNFVDLLAERVLDARVSVAADDELGELAMAFNDMAEGLAERERMSRFVSDRVLEEVKKGDHESLALGGERRFVAVLFTHIHGFNALLDGNSPEAVVELLNSSFTSMSAALERHRGRIDKLIGDALMALFDENPGQEHPAARAVAAAAEMRVSERVANAARIASGGFAIRTDIGVHFGPAIIGKVGSRLGLIDFTAIGDTVNTAARIQAAAALEPSAAILCSDAVRQHLPSLFSINRLGRVAMKGKAETADLFSIDDPEVAAAPRTGAPSR